MMDPTIPRRTHSVSEFLFLLILFVHPLLRACWDLWAQLLVYLVLCVILLLHFLERKFRPGAAEPTSVAGNAILPLGIYAAAGIVSISLSAFPHSAYRALTVDATSLLFFYGATQIASEKIHTYIAAIVASAVVVCLWAVAESWPRFGPLSGPLINANVLAGFILLLLPSACETFRQKNGAARGFWFLVIVLLTACAFMTKSILGAILVVFLMFQELLGNRRKLCWSAATIVSMGIFSWILLTGNNRIFRDADRLVWWKTSLRIWTSHPLWGAGPGAFGEAYPGYRATLWDQNSLYAHNWLLEMLAERGMIGTGGFLLWLAILGKNILRGARLRKHFLSLGIAAFLFYNLLHIGFSFPSVAWTFWFLGGILWTLTAKNESPALSTPVKFRPMIVFGTAGVLCVIGFMGLRVFRADQFAAKAQFLLSQKKWNDAEVLVQQGLRWNPGEPELYSMQAQILNHQSSFAEADLSAENALRLAPTNADFHVLSGEIKSQLGRPMEAMERFREAGRLMPLNVLPWLRQAQLYEGLQQWDEALKSYTQAEDAIKKRATVHTTASAESEMEKIRFLEDSRQRVRGKIDAAR